MSGPRRGGVDPRQLTLFDTRVVVTALAKLGLPAPAPVAAAPDVPTRADRNRALWLRWQAGDEAARGELIQGNMGWVTRVVQSLGYGTQRHLEDSVSEGALGLIRAIETWDPDRSSLATHSEPWIREVVVRLWNRSRLPVSMSKERARRVHRIRREAGAMEQALGQTPTAGALVAALGESRDMVDRALTGPSVSLDEGMGGNLVEGAGKTVADTLADPAVEDRAARQETRDEVTALLAGLAPADRDLMVAHWGLGGMRPLAASELAARLGTTRGQIRHQLTRVLAELKAAAQR